MDILRMDEMEISEIAIRVKDFNKLHEVSSKLNDAFSKELNKKGKPKFEVHTWEKLHPFYNIARMIDIMTFFIKLMLIAIVLISIMNVMVMAVYERIREIGTIAAMGTMPEKILSMFVIEGFSLGVFGVILGNILGTAIIFILNVSKITFNFGRQTGLLLTPTLHLQDVLVISIIVIIISVIASLSLLIRHQRWNQLRH